MATSLITEMNREGFRLTFSENGDYAGFVRSAPDMHWIAVPIGIDSPAKEFHSLEAAEFYCLAFACEARAIEQRNASEPSCELATRCSDMPRE